MTVTCGTDVLHRPGNEPFTRGGTGERPRYRVTVWFYPWTTTTPQHRPDLTGTCDDSVTCTGACVPTVTVGTGDGPDHVDAIKTRSSTITTHHTYSRSRAIDDISGRTTYSRRPSQPGGREFVGTPNVDTSLHSPEGSFREVHGIVENNKGLNQGMGVSDLFSTLKMYPRVLHRNRGHRKGWI